MDNLTHSLVGALIGQMGLKRKTGLAMPTLIIAANIPDIDAVATLLGGHQHLAIRRGITHGPIAMVVLPLLLWAAMLAWDRWRPSANRLPVHKGWLLTLAYIGCLSHPLFDWFNSYGIRLLEPFSSQWFYGDTIFIIDIWLWIALVAGVWMSVRRERTGSSNWRIPAVTSLVAIVGYIFANGLITGRAERMTFQAVEQKHGLMPTLVVANPVPVQFWRREMLWRDKTRFGQGTFSAPNVVVVDDKVGVHQIDGTKTRALAKDNPDAAAYLFWSRMPVVRLDGEGTVRQINISDQRFGNPIVSNRFTVSVPVKDE
ncbi:MAG: metal-dependent hydrolase [Sphingomonadaceae bacterium]|nr:metal-dependent hydrolase [Sphingomonadaceae bacterium]